MQVSNGLPACRACPTSTGANRAALRLARRAEHRPVAACCAVLPAASASYVECELYISSPQGVHQGASVRWPVDSTAVPSTRPQLVPDELHEWDAETQAEVRVQLEVYALARRVGALQDTPSTNKSLLRDVKLELVSHLLLLRNMKFRPQYRHSIFDSALQHEANQLVTAGVSVWDLMDAYACEGSNMTIQQEAEVCLRLDINSLSARYSKLLEDVARMRADPAYAFTTSDPMARTHKLIQACKHLRELEEGLLTRQLLLRNLSARPDLRCSLSDPGLAKEVQTVMQQRRRLNKLV